MTDSIVSRLQQILSSVKSVTYRTLAGYFPALRRSTGVPDPGLNGTDPLEHFHLAYLKDCEYDFRRHRCGRRPGDRTDWGTCLVRIKEYRLGQRDLRPAARGGVRHGLHLSVRHHIRAALGGFAHTRCLIGALK